MPFVECGNGHVFDNSQNATCPYCNGGGARINFGAPGPQQGIGKTMPGSMYAPGGASPAPGAGMGAPAINQVGSTMAPSNYKAAQAAQPVQASGSKDSGKTVAVFKKKTNIEPVVGWLVCIDGASKGKDYRILAKNNSLGRGENMDICITGDTSISRENHARIGYDEKNNAFHLIPGESMNNVYIKGQPVYTPTKLEPYNVIEIGETKLLFVPLCYERFNWQIGFEVEE